MAQDLAYSGVENLEVMESAKRYTEYLAQLVATAAGPTAAAPRLLDFGAGSGTIAVALTSAGYSVTCLEPDARLRDRLADRGLRVVADARELAAGEQFDLVYSMNVLEHVPDDAAALRGIGDLVRHGGRLLLYVPAFEVLFSTMDRKVGHLRRYRAPDLARLVDAAGFVVEEAAYADSLGFLAALAYRGIGSRDGELNERSVAAYDRYVFPASRQLDRLTKRWFGKNVVVRARRP
jgi:SAM-dependent methyltransferase